MTKAKGLKQMMSVVLCVALLMSCLPMWSWNTSAALVGSADSRTTDPHTLDQWKQYFGLQSNHPQNVALSTEFAGGVWTDKSVFTPATIPTELTRAEYKGTSFSLPDKGDNFLVALSAIASNKEITGYSTVPTDTVLVLDMSSSMRYNDDNGQSAIDELVEATNLAIADLLELNKNNRVAVVLYAGNTNQSFSSAGGTTQILLPLDTYNIRSNGVYLQATSSGGNANWALRVANGVSGTNGTVSGNKATSTGTFIQDGIYEAMKVLLAAEPTVQSGVQAGTQRLPIMVLMTDGEPTLANNDYDGNAAQTDLGNSVMHDFEGHTGTYSHRDTIAFMTMLTAAYAKKQVAAHYGDALFYTLAYGEEVTRLDEALSVMDPEQCSDPLNELWNSFLSDKATTVYRYRQNNRYQYLTATNAASGPARLLAADKLYVDEYFPAETDEDFAKAFAAIVNEIIIQSKYYPTYVESDHDHDGYLTFVDKIGSYMQVGDIKGIVVGNRLFSGAAMASAFGDADATLGTLESPTAMGNAFIASVKERLGIADTAVAQALVADAYKHGQLAYTNDQQFSHYIGWFSDANGTYLDFWHDGMTDQEVAAVAAQKGATHIIKSYGFLGDTAVVGGVSDTDMMYMSVRVATSIASGETILTWRLPASLIPTVTYEVSVRVDSDGNIVEVTDLDLEADSAESPIRLLYEVELREDISDWNVTEKVADAYAASTVNKDAGYVFYTNKWTADADDTEANTYSHFEPSVENERYYYTEDALVYADDAGTLYTGAKPTSGTYYRQYLVYEKLENGEVRAHKHYEPITATSLALTEAYGTNQWVIPKGTVHRYYDFENSPKETNATDTMNYSDHPFIVSGEAHYYTYSTQGNNGKLAVTPATGLRLTKTLTETVEGASNRFTFTVAGDIANARVVRVDANGNETSRTALPTSGEVVVAAGETVYIIGLNAGEYTVTEKDHAAYAVSTVTVDGVSAGKEATLTVTAKTIHDVQFVNAPKGYGNLLITKEVTHALAQHTPPAAVLDQAFTVQVNVGTALAGEELGTLVGSTAGKVTVGEDGAFRLTVKHGQTVQVLNLPEETVATVTELTNGLPAYYTYKGIATRDHSGAAEDADNQVRISANENATAVVYNTYNPVETDPVNVNVNITKQFNANGWAGNATFTFKLQQWILPAGETAYQWVDMDTAALDFTATAQKSITLPNGMGGITYKEAGQYAYRVVEVIPAAADKVPGVTYDRTHHAFTVTVTDNNGKLEAAVTDAAGHDIAGGYDVTFTNTYHTAPFSFDIIKQVIDTSDNAETPKAGFQFHVVEEKYDGGQWVATGKTAALYSNAAGEAEFATIFEKVDGGTYPVYYRYRVTEEAGNLPGWTYATNTEYVYVTLEVNGEKLVATVTDEDRNPLPSVPTPTFTNTYDPADATVNLDSAVRKYLEGRDLGANEFTFAVFQNGAYSFTDTQKALLIGKNAADGSVDFAGELTFDKIGTYEFDIVEIAGDLGGVTYTDRVYDLVVEVTDAGNGTLSATYYFEDAVDRQVTFTNTYTATPATTVIEGEKVLTGRPMLSGEFDFRLTEVADETGAALPDALVLTAENGSATGDTAPFRFPAITYDKAGTHYYKVEEIAGAADLGVTYATNTYILRVEVTDTGSGTLVAAQSLVHSSDNSTALVFRNTYKPAKATTSLHSTKELTGRVLADGEFEFVITETESDFATPINGGLQATVRNNASGGIDFPEIEFATEDIRYFVIKEVVGTVPGITYDTSEYHVIITAEDQQKGALALSTYIMKQVVEEDENGQTQTVKVPTSSVIFANTYVVSGNATVTLNGSKTLNGETPANRPFEFLLYAADADYTASGTPETVTQDANGNFTFDLTYRPEDISDTPYYYVVKEAHGGETIEGVTYDDTVYHIEVKVEDNNEGGIKTTTVIKKNGATAVTALAFANSYRAEEVTLSVTGTKTLENRTLAENEFKFFLYPANSEYVIDESATAKETANKADGSIVFENISFSEAGTYYFVIREDAATTAERVTNDTSVYRVAIEIKDDEKGKLYEAGRVITKEGSTEKVETIAFHNVFTPKPADITVDIAVNKTVVNKGADTITPEGFRFLLENTATNEKWNLATDVNGGAVFTLSYTEEDIGKTYTYTLAEENDGRANVQYSDAVYTLTVAISLNANNELVAALTKNDEAVDAVVAEFENVYDHTPTTTTPPTTTPTTTPPTTVPPTTVPPTTVPPTTVPPTTVPPTIPSSRPNSPQTGESTNIPLYVVLLMLSGSGLVVTALGGKKKKQTEE